MQKGTIDDALGDLGDKEGKEQQEQPEEVPSIDPTPDTLVDEARGIMGSLLVNYFEGKIAGQNMSHKISDAYKSIIEEIGLFLFKIIPKKTMNNQIALYVDFNSDLEDNQIKEILRLTAGDYALQTDLANLAHKENLSELMEKFPDFNQIHNDLLKEISNWPGCFEKATLHPYLFVMGMKNTYRAFTTLVVEKALANHRISLLSTELPSRPSDKDIAGWIQNMTPTSHDFIETAKEYNIKEIIPYLDAFSAISGKYKDKWPKVD